MKKETIESIKGRVNAGFNAVEAAEPEINTRDKTITKLAGVLQVLLDPENQPSNLSIEDAWKMCKDDINANLEPLI